MNSLDWTLQAFVDGWISTETLQPDGVEPILKVLDAKAGWIQEDESKLLLRQALFKCGKRQRRVPAAEHDEEVGADRGSLGGRSRHYAHGHMEQCPEGRCAVVKAVRTDRTQHTSELQHGARRRRSRARHPGRGRAGRHHQGGRQTSGALFCGHWRRSPG